MPIVRSATALWNAWHGLGRYKDTPICGGVGTLEEQRHVDWRRDYSQPETRMFSRYKLAISCMKEELRLAIDRGRSFEEMDKLFREAKTCSISPFEVKMKSRRKKRKAEAASLNEIMQCSPTATVNRISNVT